MCTRREIGEDCAATTAAEPREPGLLVEATIEHEVWRKRMPRRMKTGALATAGTGLDETRRGGRGAPARRGAPPHRPPRPSSGAAS